MRDGEIEKSARWFLCACVALAGVIAPRSALAWGNEGHRIIAAIARSYLTPAVLGRVDSLLAADTDPLAAHDMLSAATWADAYRTNHRETAQWHFADIELSKPDLAAACFGFPAPAKPASAGPAQDCLVDRINAFAAELSDPATPQPEKILALKFVLHLVGDLHQPLHASDNQDRGGNCVRLALGGPRTSNLHSFWDTALVEGMGSDAVAVASELRAKITSAQIRAGRKGDPTAWAMESFGVAKTMVYTLGTQPGCDPNSAPISLPAGYQSTAEKAAAVQLQRAGLRLASVLNRALAH
jgi:hypothetical protein